VIAGWVWGPRERGFGVVAAVLVGFGLIMWWFWLVCIGGAAPKDTRSRVVSFLGLGAPLNAPSWGNMLSDSRQYLVNAPWMMFVPAGAIVSAVISLNLIGDGVAEISRKRARAVEA